MALSKQAVAGGVAALGGTGAVAGVVIANQNKGTTIREELGDYLIKETSDFTKRWDQKGTETAPTDVGSESGKKSLETWCKEQYGVVITDEIKTVLLKQVEKWCTFTIKQKLGDKVLSTVDTANQTDEEDWKIKSKNLTDYEEAEPGQTFEWNKEIEDVQKETNNETTETNKWKKIRDWCKKTYELNHLKETVNTLEIANKFCTKATIKDALYGTELSEKENFKEDWTKKITDALPTSGDTGVKDTQLKADLQGKTGTNAEKEKIEKLKEWCRDQYKEHHKTQKTWSGSSAENLLNEVKKWCTLTIKEKLDTNSDSNKRSISDTNDDASLEKNIKALNNYSKGATDPELTKKLKEIQNTTNKESTDKKGELKTWCQGIWNKGYKNNDLYKLADKFCRKNTN